MSLMSFMCRLVNGRCAIPEPKKEVREPSARPAPTSAGPVPPVPEPPKRPVVHPGSTEF